MTHSALFLAVFLACAVEAVEALTIFLAAGTAGNWRSATVGMGGAVVVLGAVVAVLGPAVSAIPLRGLRLVVGALLLIFGLQWLRKAMLRASGYQALHDETQIFERAVVAARGVSHERRAFVTDWYAFTLSFKGVLLEGLEVVFVALTFGSNARNVGLASVAAVAAVLVVAVTGFAVRAPLARVPENSMKFVVGIMLTGFGLFWGAEGAGAQWPGGDAALPVVVAAVAVVAFAGVATLKRAHAAVPEPARAFVVGRR